MCIRDRFASSVGPRPRHRLGTRGQCPGHGQTALQSLPGNACQPRLPRGAGRALRHVGAVG
eukprot:4097400-Lingulodinium_polyedra.AAC.1